MKFITIVGAPPQFIKAATISRILRQVSKSREIIVHTGQHYDPNMSEIFFHELEIPQPDYHLNIGSGTHGQQTGRMLETIETVILEEKPDYVIVYGDTNSTLAGALAASKLHIPIAHIEAGLRSFNRRMPEEINRLLTDHIAELLFPPTSTAVSNLQREGIAENKIYMVGDVMYDAALYYGDKAESQSSILDTLGLQSQEYILATIHRAENTDAPVRLRAIFTALKEISQQYVIVLPLHPRTRKALQQQGMLEDVSQYIRLIEPVGYLDMVMLEKNAKLITTDSGGVQKEAFFYRVPCLTLREETEWVELVELGYNTLVSPHLSSAEISLIFQSSLTKMPFNHPELYGSGQAAEKITNILIKTLL